jgi:PIN domain nuclease of toxin-antitoxin system
MASAVLDASAVLAHISGEPGCDYVTAIAADALICSVNLAEIFSKLLERKVSQQVADAALYRYGFDIVTFDEELARRVGQLRMATKNYGLSLGDRACLALAQREGLPAVTVDREWAKLDLGIEVTLLR